MDIEAVFDRLMEAGVSVWIDFEGKLRIDKDAPPELKELVREHKQPLLDVKRAAALMNDEGIRIIRLPLGHLALAYHLGTDLDRIRWAMKVLRMDSMPLVVNDEGLGSMTWDEWKRRHRVRNAAEPEPQAPQREPQRTPKLQFGRKTA